MYHSNKLQTKQNHTKKESELLVKSLPYSLLIVQLYGNIIHENDCFGSNKYLKNEIFVVFKGFSSVPFRSSFVDYTQNTT